MLLVSKHDPLCKAKDDLVKALHASGKEKLNGAPVPFSGDDVELAVPEDRNDPSKGWVPLVGPDAEDKLMSQTRSAGQNTGLRENAILAFRFRGTGDQDLWNVKVATLADADAIAPQSDDLPNDGMEDI